MQRQYGLHGAFAEGALADEDGTLLVAGSLSADALADRLGLDYGDDREFATVAGYCLAVMKKLPSEGEWFEEQGWRFEVVDLDERRIDKVLVSEIDGKPEADEVAGD